MKAHSLSSSSRARMAAALASYKTELWQVQLNRTSGQTEREGGKEGEERKKGRRGNDNAIGSSDQPNKYGAWPQVHLNAIGFCFFFFFLMMPSGKKAALTAGTNCII